MHSKGGAEERGRKDVEERALRKGSEGCACVFTHSTTCRQRQYGYATETWGARSVLDAILGYFNASETEHQCELPARYGSSPADEADTHTNWKYIDTLAMPSTVATYTAALRWDKGQSTFLAPV